LLPEQQLFANARRFLAPFEAELTRLARFSDPQQVYYYCPCSAP
jgi:protease-4